MEQQYIKTNKILKDNFGELLKYLGKGKPTKTPIEKFYEILDKLKEKKLISKVYGKKYKQIEDNKELFDKVTNCNNFEQVFSALGGYTNDNFKLIDTL